MQGRTGTDAQVGVDAAAREPLCCLGFSTILSDVVAFKH